MDKQQLFENIKRKKSFLCVGLDTDIKKIPEHLLKEEDPTFVMILTVYGRMFKIYMYTAIAPIPISSFAGEPTQSIGKNFIRSYIGVCLEGAIIALACIIFSAYAASLPAVGSVRDTTFIPVQ